MCGSRNLVPVLQLGDFALTGVFPRAGAPAVASGPLELVQCRDGSSCGLVQLRHSYELGQLYGANYGYRSGLNRSMVQHLQEIVAALTARRSLEPGDLVVDIGSNDSTLLRAYERSDVQRVGIDPSGEKFRGYYPPDVQLVPAFFSVRALQSAVGDKRARIVSSIAMFYDLESPLDFMREVEAVLAPDGIWIFEQSYLPAMLATNAYDTVCHEHLEYYGMKQVKWLADRAGLKVIAVEINDVNGGSFAVTCAKRASSYPEATEVVARLVADEERTLPAALAAFPARVRAHRDQLRALVADAKRAGKLILGYGASTKGNVILQFCGFSPDDIPAIAEVNEEKFGCVTPGTRIPIISEPEAHQRNPDYLLVLPWHFKKGIVERERDFLRRGGALVLPLPDIEVVTG
jgi:NDP-4-keto-2,6-dideoxyhexose 3-C-methyltransferase